MRINWLIWTSLRFLTGRKYGRGRWIFITAVLLIALGITTLITILSVMNGLQQNFIRNILEIGSYHIKWIPSNQINDLNKVLAGFNQFPEIKLALPYRESQTIIKSYNSKLRGAIFKGVPQNIYAVDEGLSNQIKITEGQFILTGNSVVIGRQIAKDLDVLPGDKILVMSLNSSVLNSVVIELTVTGIFTCGYYAYENSIAFISLKTADNLFSEVPLEIGIKLNKIELDRVVISQLESSNSFNQGQFISWRTSNQAFFSALRNEKMMMFILLGLIFVVVSINIDFSFRRIAKEREEDLSILKATGASPNNIRVIFLLNGIYIGLTAGIIGSLMGVLIGENIDVIVNFIRQIIYIFGNTDLNNVYLQSLFSFFNVSNVMFKDVIGINIIVISLTFLAAIRASSIAAKCHPAEVLRSE